MNKKQLNELALRIDANKGVIDSQELMMLSDAAGVDFNKTFRGITELDGALINRVLNLAHNNAKREEIKKANTVTITGQAEYKAQELEKLRQLSTPVETEDQRFIRIANDIWKARKENK